MHPEQLSDLETDVFPFGRDGLLYWDAVEAFVKAATDGDGALNAEKLIETQDVQTWWQQLDQLLPDELGPLTVDSFRKLVSLVIFTVSGLHSWVGHATPYVEDPAICSGKMRPNLRVSDRQASEQLSVVTCVTGLPMPKLEGDFLHLMPDEESVAAAKAFKDAIAAMKVEIDRRNSSRDIALKAFDSAVLTLSVAI